MFHSARLVAAVLLVGAVALRRQRVRSAFTDVSYSSLMTYDRPDYTAPDHLFGPGADALPASNSFEGRVYLPNRRVATKARIEELKDLFRYTLMRKYLPPFDFEFVQTSDGRLVPSVRGLVNTDDNFWNIIVGVGAVWDEPGNVDQGYSRASFPFALVQRNSQCVMNGVMLFLYKSSGEASYIRYQVTQETCFYYQINLYGQLQVEYTPKAVSGASAIRAAWVQELADRTPVKSLVDDLGKDYPGVDASVFASGVPEADLTTYGVVAGGTVYTARCRTRQGEYYYCSEMVTPSYSVAKSLFAGLAMMRLAQRYGAGVYAERILDWVSPNSSCVRGDWTNVTFKNTLDMATGNYGAEPYAEDESSSLADEFFLAEPYADKLCHAFEWPFKVSRGTFFSYHTSDTFIVTVAMQNYLRARSDQPNDADVFDFLVNDVFRPLKMQAGSHTSSRTDAECTTCRNQAYGGYGLFFTIDDISKITQFVTNGGRIGTEQVVHAASLQGALQQSSSDQGLVTNSQNGGPLGPPVYNYGFWAIEYNVRNCRVMVPYASGYGGIRYIFNPNGVVYFYVSDSGQFIQEPEILEVDKMAPQC